MVNNVVLVGRITRDPELKTSQSGTSVVNFGLAINRNFKNQAGEYEADFINCVAFNQTAQLMEQYVTKGQLISVQGRLQTRNYEDKDGKKVYVTEVICNTVTFLESKKNVVEDKGEDFFNQNATKVSVIDEIDENSLPF